MKVTRVVIDFDNGQRQVVQPDDHSPFDVAVNYTVVTPRADLHFHRLAIPTRFEIEVTGRFQVIQTVALPDRVELLPCRVCGTQQGPIWLPK